VEALIAALAFALIYGASAGGHLLWDRLREDAAWDENERRERASRWERAQLAWSTSDPGAVR
jgi:hypothetical protein